MPRVRYTAEERRERARESVRRYRHRCAVRAPFLRIAEWAVLIAPFIERWKRCQTEAR